ncbi:Uncharacterized protein SCF082_LOCUS11359, partial [Durusdinium trenchii]
EAMSGKGGHRGGQGNRSAGNWGSHGATYSYGAHNAAHNPFEVKLPRFLNWLEYNEVDQSENSLIMVDDRDVRMVSPFQCWLTREIMANSASSINVLTERDQVMPPNSGFHLSLFGNYTLDGIKAVIVIALDTETGGHLSYTDVKVYNGNEILFHWIFRGYRADTDLTVQQQFVDEVLLREWSWLLSSAGGSRFELRVCNRSSQDAMGNDADRVEFRFRDANTRLDLKCQRTAVPGTWLTVSHISGPTLIQTIQNVRQARARVEGPEHTEQFGQLAAVHEHWFNWAVAENAEDVGCLVDFIGDLDEGNFHITATSKLWTRAPEIVNPKAIAEMQHQEAGLAAPFGPPAITEGAWRHVAERVVVTPAIFASQIRSKTFNETSATIEEVDNLPPGDLELPTAASGGRPTDAAGMEVETKIPGRRCSSVSWGSGDPSSGWRWMSMKERMIRSLGCWAQWGGDQEDRDVVLRRIELAPLLFNLILQSRSKIMGEIATDLGYGHGSAGSHAQINRSLPGAEITAGEQAEIRELVFGAGAFRTIRVNVLAWERMEKWAGSQGLSVYPLTNSRLVMPVPDTDDPHVGAIIQKVYLDRGKELREAVEVPLPVVAALEYLVNALILEGKKPAALFVWWTLILIYASLRWDDGRHVAPASLELTEEALLGLVWQTKVERKRKGTRFAVPRCSIAGVEWLDEGWQ